MTKHLQPLPPWHLMGIGPRTVITYRRNADEQTTIRLSQANDIDFEYCLPVRDIPEHVGQPNTPGMYWSATTQQLVHYESFLESKWLTVLDFDPHIDAFSCQAIRFDGVDAEGAWDHTPDIFARRADGSPLLIDIKHPRLMALNDAVGQQRRTRAVAAELGWDYGFIGEPNTQLWASLSWLAGFRRPPHAGHHYLVVLLDAATRAITIGDLCSTCSAPEIARPVLFHLMWRQDITFDLTQPLRQSTLVQTRGDGPAFHLNLADLDIGPTTTQGDPT